MLPDRYKSKDDALTNVRPDVVRDASHELLQKMADMQYGFWMSNEEWEHVLTYCDRNLPKIMGTA